MPASKDLIFKSKNLYFIIGDVEEEKKEVQVQSKNVKKGE